VTTSDSEESVWTGGPSQVLNFGIFLACALVALVLVALALVFSGYIGLGVLAPGALALWKFLEVRCLVYELTSERLRIFEGVLNQDIDEIELYRVKDSRIERPFWLRLFGLGNIALETSDRTHPRPVLRAVADAREVREKIRHHVEVLRDRKRVREVDFDETGDSEFGDEIG